MALKDVLGNSLKELRKKAGLSQAQLSEISGVNLGIIKHAEIGRSWPASESLEAICGALKMPPFTLLMSSEQRAQWAAKEPASPQESLADAAKGLDPRTAQALLDTLQRMSQAQKKSSTGTSGD